MRLAVHLTLAVTVASASGVLRAEGPTSRPARHVVYRSQLQADQPADAAWTDAKVLSLAFDGKARPVLAPKKQALTLQLAQLPDHDTLILSANVYFLGIWDEPARNQPPGTNLRLLGGMLRLGSMAGGPWLGIAPLGDRLVGGSPLFVSPLADIGPVKAGRDGQVPFKVATVVLAWRHQADSLELRIDMVREFSELTGQGPLGARWALGDIRIVAATAGETGDPRLADGPPGNNADALAQLVCQPKLAITATRQLLVPKLDTDLVDRLIAELSAPSWAAREAGYRKLAEIAPIAGAYLQAKLDDKDLPTETRTRLKQLLADSRDPRMSDTQRAKAYRHLLAMRLINTPAAREMLACVAESSPWPDARSMAEVRLEYAHRVRVAAGLARAEKLAEQGEVDKTNALLAELRKGTPERFHISHNRIDRAERSLSHSGRFRKHARDLRARLETHPDDAASRAKLIYVTLVELDQPKRAAELDHESLDPFLRSGLKLFAADPGNLSEAQQYSLACRYRGLAVGASKTGQLAMLSRSRDLLVGLARAGQQSLNAPDTPGALRLAVRTYLQDLHGVEARIRELTHPLGGYENLLWTKVLTNGDRQRGLWRIEQDRVPGRQKGSATIRSEWLNVQAGSFSRLMFPVEPQGDYDLLVRFTRTKGKDGIFIHLPISDPPRTPRDQRADTVSCNLNLGGWEGAVDGLEWIDSQQANNNSTARKPSKIRTGKTHELIVSVRTGQGEKVRICTILDGQPYISWQGKRSQLQAASAWNVGKWKGNIGVGAHESDVTFHRIGVKMVTGMAIEDKTGD